MQKMRNKIFVVHEHHARRLHWDFRIQIGRVLKSWAIPKVPPRTKGIKRLAVQTPDHPLSYASFEGIIPKGSYGAGKVKIWDKGKFELKKRKPKILMFRLAGKKLNGEYCLVKFKTREGKPGWLFFKL